MASYEVANPVGSGGQVTTGSLLDQPQVLVNGAVGVGIHLNARQVAGNQGQQSGKLFALDESG